MPAMPRVAGVIPAIRQMRFDSAAAPNARTLSRILTLSAKTREPMPPAAGAGGGKPGLWGRPRGAAGAIGAAAGRNSLPEPGKPRKTADSGGFGKDRKKTRIYSLYTIWGMRRRWALNDNAGHGIG